MSQKKSKVPVQSVRLIVATRQARTSIPLRQPFLPKEAIVRSTAY
jgi:hypothetical protein